MLREFGNLIDLSNVESRQSEERERQRVCRSLAALAVRQLVECDSQTAADQVIDGRGDQGIDAVAFGDGTPEIYLIQAKWSDNGTAGIKADAARALVDGFRQIEERRFDRFNDRFQRLGERVKSILQQPRLKVTLVIAVMGDGHLAPEVVAVLDDARDSYNGFGPLLDYRVLTGSHFWQQVRADLAPPPVKLSVPMRQWLRRDEPTIAFLGSVSADMVAGWYGDHGDRLFDGNVRKALGLTTVNRGMVETLVKDPVSFWSKNNGVTVLCSEIEEHYFGSRRSGQEPVTLALRDASVVNGAQTVSAVYRAAQEAPDMVCQADISVRVIRVPDETSGFGRGITQSTNTQNHIEGRDFIALDPMQGDIRDDFALALGKTYVFQRGDVEPTPDAGCSVVQAALALACAHRNPDLAVRAKQNLNSLWDQGKGGAYPVLFGNQPSALQIWRSVLLFRLVNDAVGQQGRKLAGRAGTIADHGDFLTAHVVFQLIGSEKVEDPELNWDEQLAAVDELVRQVLLWLIAKVDEEFGSNSFVTSTFANPDKCRVLVEQVMRHIQNGDPAPDVSDEYRPAKSVARGRARSAVHVLLDAGYLDSGTALRYVPSSERERAAMADWLAADPGRARATWVLDRRRPILWEADGKQYSPSGLVMHMWQLADWTDSPVAVQGPKCWHRGTDGSLVDLAAALRGEEETA